MKLTIPDLYDLDHTLAGDYLRQFTYPWAVSYTHLSRTHASS